MKKCKKCEQLKDESEFYKQVQRGSNGQTWPYLDCYCKACRLKATSDRSKSIKVKAIEYLGGKCQDCGLVDEPCVYDFHHLDPSKKELSFGKNKGLSFNVIKPELDKCVILCANCHRKRHSITQIF